MFVLVFVSGLDGVWLCIAMMCGSDVYAVFAGCLQGLWLLDDVCLSELFAGAVWIG